ncbi:flagellar hook-associated protein FlgK [Pseudomonas umsongensis]|uniref:Flagellar hook-associated protein 1 n=1 Tax=Pseudomonas umsongensis TaxID=198618 RepID=A0ABX4DY02_9PSED|nr:flagellar hook-associated protein FlgK [Pseudomonas umsongensis]OXR33267.1 flagellar hook-associated protein FlgK [Pseudomonas umsongensis]SDS47459.1 flagellar hook-associated protein 1 FlgK [Pseudomonas umsongensis]
MSLLNIGMSGLNASQVSLATVGNNIANANTAGYSRQQTTQVSNASNLYGGVFIGSGTTLADVRRVYNAYLDNQLQTSTSLSSDANAYLDQVNPLDKLFSDKNTGISAVLSSFFTSVQTAAGTPSDTAARQLLLTNAQTLSNRFNALASQMTQQNEGINSQLTTLTGQVNQLTASIASLNQQIAQASTSSGSGPSNLLDARNEAVRSLNELVGVTVQEQNGSYNVSLGNGQPLVLGNTSNTLSTARTGIDKSQLNIQLNSPSKTSDVTSVISGGKIGGLLRYRDDVLVPAQNDLGRTALVMADKINSQLGQGLDANGEFGASLFSNINSATAISQRSLGASNNSTGSGNLDVTITNSSALTTFDYSVTFTAADKYTVKRSDGKDMGSFDLSPAAEIDGFKLDLNGGGLSAGDSFKVTPTRNAASSIKTQMTDSNKLAFAGPLVATGSTSNGGTGALTPPVLSTPLDIYGGADLAALQAGIKDSMPVTLAFKDAAGGSQAYEVFNSKGQSIGTGTIVPGQSNDLTINVPMLDASGAPIPGQSFSFNTTVSGSPSKNDKYEIAFNADGKKDNRNANELLALQTKATVGVTGGNAGMSMTTAYSRLVEQVGAKASQALGDSTASGAILSRAKSEVASVSQVNLDDEAADLLKFQQYYTASSQIIKAAQETFSTLINSL